MGTEPGAREQEGRGKGKRKSGVSRAAKRAVKGMERTELHTGLGEGKGSRGGKCINKTSQTWSSVTLSKMCKGEKSP